MTIREFLPLMFDVNRKLKSAREQTHEAYEDAGISSPGFTERVSKSPTASTVERVAEMREQTITRYITTLRTFLDMRDIAYPLFQQLDILQQVIMRRRYGLGQPWADVAKDMGMNKSYIMRLHREAIENLGKYEIPWEGNNSAAD